MGLTIKWRTVEDILEIPPDIRNHAMYASRDWWIHIATMRKDGKIYKMLFEDASHTWELQDDGSWKLTADTPRKTQSG